jgi:hypothetical protein
VADASGYEDESASARAGARSVQLELGFALQDPERLDAIGMNVCGRPPSTWRNSALVQREGAIGIGGHRFEDQLAPARGQALACAGWQHDSVSHEYLHGSTDTVG